MKTVNFAIVGCGKIGLRHAQKMHGVMGAKLIAVCDIIPQKARALGTEHNAKIYYDIHDLVKDKEVDFVNICTPSGLHYSLTIISLNNGKHVLCEKPFALTSKNALEMVKTAQSHRKNLFVVKQNRYNPPVEYVNKLIQQKKMGKPILCIVNVIWNRNNDYYASDAWRGTQLLDGGTIFTQVSHYIDLMLLFMGPAKSLYSQMGTMDHAIEIEDTGVVSVNFKSGALGTVNYTTCATNKNFEGSITLVFSHGTIKIGGECANQIEYRELDTPLKHRIPRSKNGANNYTTYFGSMSNHDLVFKDIVSTMNNKKVRNVLVSGSDAIATVTFMESALLSAQKNRIITL